MKICATCGGETKPLNEYYKHKRARDGHDGTCKACRLARKYELRRERDKNYGKCRMCGGEREYGKSYCDKCRTTKRKLNKRHNHQVNQMRTLPDYTPVTKTSDCDTCILAIDCLERVKRGYDPYCWNGENTNNRYYYLYERAKAETGVRSR